MRKSVDHLGEESFNKKGTVMKIIEYINNRKVLVEFQDEYKYQTYTNYQAFIKGEVKNVYDKSVYGVGYIGEGQYSHKTHPHSYNVWKHMIARCYDKVTATSNPSYINCYVSDDWLCFQNFASWFDENYYEIPGEIMHLDKDILIKGNLQYSSETCTFVPQRINSLFTKNDMRRGNLPIGCYYHGKSICVSCNTLDGRVQLGRYDTTIKAFEAYKMFKEKYIQKVADEYRDIIPNNLYEAMYNYKVEIND